MRNKKQQIANKFSRFRKFSFELSLFFVYLCESNYHFAKFSKTFVHGK